MAVLACGGIRASRFLRETVDTCAVTFGLALVTQAAIDGLQREVVVGMFLRHISVATETRIGFVSGRGELGDICEQRDLLPGCVRLRERSVRVTLQTIAVF